MRRAGIGECFEHLLRLLVLLLPYEQLSVGHGSACAVEAGGLCGEGPEELDGLGVLSGGDQAHGLEVVGLLCLPGAEGGHGLDGAGVAELVGGVGEQAHDAGANLHGHVGAEEFFGSEICLEGGGVLSGILEELAL